MLSPCSSNNTKNIAAYHLVRIIDAVQHTTLLCTTLNPMCS